MSARGLSAVTALRDSLIDASATSALPKLCATIPGVTGQPLDERAYDALRATIRTRGTARVALFIAGMCVWAVLSFALLLVPAVPLATVFPLVLLAATFEAVFGLHVGVERIGRYLQVFCDDRWEATAMAFGAPLAGTGSDPLFTVPFAIAVVCNFIPVMLAGPVPAELGVLGALHAVVIVRLLLAKRAASRQRAADLARFQQIKAGGVATKDTKDTKTV
jgi:hypothetical protein